MSDGQLPSPRLVGGIGVRQSLAGGYAVAKGLQLRRGVDLRALRLPKFFVSERQVPSPPAVAGIGVRQSLDDGHAVSMRLQHRRAIAGREPKFARSCAAGRHIPLLRLVAAIGADKRSGDLGEKRRYRARRAFELLRRVGHPSLRCFTRRLDRLLRAVPLQCREPRQAQCDARADQGNRRHAPRIS